MRGASPLIGCYGILAILYIRRKALPHKDLRRGRPGGLDVKPLIATTYDDDTLPMGQNTEILSVQ